MIVYIIDYTNNSILVTIGHEEIVDKSFTHFRSKELQCERPLEYYQIHPGLHLDRKPTPNRRYDIYQFIVVNQFNVGNGDLFVYVIQKSEYLEYLAKQQDRKISQQLLDKYLSL